MKSAEQINLTVDSWIVEDDLPVRANLKVIRKNGPDCETTDDEIADRNEFIRCQLLKDFEPLMWVPQQAPQDDFFIPDFTVEDEEWSAFNTHDFQRMQRPFNTYGYAMKKLMERVKDRAIVHSSISSPEDRKAVCGKHEAFVDREFRERLRSLADRYTRTVGEERCLLKQKIAEINRKVLECKKIWERYAPPENWDR